MFRRCQQQRRTNEHHRRDLADYDGHHGYYDHDVHNHHYHHDRGNDDDFNAADSRHCGAG